MTKQPGLLLSMIGVVALGVGIAYGVFALDDCGGSQRSTSSESTPSARVETTDAFYCLGQRCWRSRSACDRDRSTRFEAGETVGSCQGNWEAFCHGRGATEVCFSGASACESDKNAVLARGERTTGCEPR